MIQQDEFLSGTLETMTWVIGGSSIFGTAVMLSDIRVTYQNGATADILKKAYYVGPLVLAGFAGSVRIGFRMIESIARRLIPPSGLVAPPGMVPIYHPSILAREWAPEARAIFHAFPPYEQKLRSMIMIVGVSPVENIGIPNFLASRIVTFSSPDFRPKFSKKRGREVRHIGSGSGVKPYVETIEKYFSNTPDANFTTKADAYSNAWGWFLGRAINEVAEAHPVEHVSPNVHITTIRRNQVYEMTNDSTPSEPRTKMPPVATNYSQFAFMSKQIGQVAEAAIA